MESSRSLRTRAVLALLLMVGFYGFALAIAAGLLWIPYAEYIYLDRVSVRVVFLCVLGGGTILWALVPRFDKFEAPGPRLTPSNAPHLFTMINDIARATSQPRPEDVYLLNDVNAFVTQRGGMMGFGSRRVMGIGLPLIKGLSPAELRSVIAHEFGHYVSGDVALGPWIYKTRATIGRTLQGVSPVLQAGFLPPVSEGFERYMNDPDLHQVFQEYAKHAIGAEAGEFDTHPPTAERIAALEPRASR
ncbi:MAG: M48 family metallopeptidase [Vicinamibacterales bacterium]|nr:M48 family metallopeptidase [Vicinamibacterales bacterium]